MCLIEMFGTFQKIEPCSAMLESPEPRSGHRMCAADNFLYVFGGYDAAKSNILYNELWRYNMTTKYWIKLPDNNGSAPIECTSNSMLLWRNNIIIYGGSGYPFGVTNSSKLLMYSLKYYKWIELVNQNHETCTKYKACGCSTTLHESPTAKYGQSMIITQDSKLVIYAGTTGTAFVQELHTYHLYKQRWKSYKFCEQHSLAQPKSRYRHEGILYKSDYFILGGSVLEETFGFEKIHSLDISRMLWEKHCCSSDVYSGDNKLPQPRRHHSCTLYKHNIYMIGGSVYNNNFLDAWLLNLDTMKWKKDFRCFPYAVRFHAAAVTSAGCLYVFGGVDSKQQRVSDLHMLWLEPPSLLEQSWMAVVNLLQQNRALNTKVLVELGVPKTFLLRIDDSIPPAG